MNPVDCIDVIGCITLPEKVVAVIVPLDRISPLTLKVSVPIVPILESITVLP